MERYRRRASIWGLVLVMAVSVTACGEKVDMGMSGQVTSDEALAETDVSTTAEGAGPDSTAAPLESADGKENISTTQEDILANLTDHYIETIPWEDLDGNGVQEYLVIENDAFYGSVTMYFNEEPVYRHEEELRIIGVDAREYIDLDEDGEKEIFVSFMPAVNSMPLEEWFALKQGETGWELMEMQHYGEDMLDNGFPINVTLQEKDFQLLISCEGCEKTIPFDATAHYAEREKEKEFGDLSYDAYIEGDFGKGSVVGETCAWGVWNIVTGTYEGKTCLIAEHGLQGPGGKFDFYGCADVYFNYDENAQINILNLEFRPNVTEASVATKAPGQTDSLVLSKERVADYTSEELIEAAYQECRRIFSMLNSSLAVGSGNLAGKDIELPGLGDGWYEVLDEDFTCIQDIKDYAEAVLTPDFAKTEFYKGLFEGDSPAIVEAAGKLYTQLFDGPGLQAVKEITITKNGEDQLHANLAVDETLGPSYYMKLCLVQEEAGWRVDDLYYLEDEHKPKEAGKLFMMESLEANTEVSWDTTIIPLPMNATVSVDLDGDGTKELVNATICKDNALHFAVPIVRVNDFVFDEEYMNEMARVYMECPDVATWYLFDLDVNDGYKEIGLYEDGPSGDPWVTLLRYHDGQLREIGGFSDKPIDEWSIYHAAYDGDYLEYVENVNRSQIRIQVPGDGTVYARQRMDVIETNFAEGLWKLQNAESFEEANLELQLRDMYEFYGYGSDRGEYTPTVRDTLQVFAEPDFEADIITLTKGEDIDIYRYYPIEDRLGWVQLGYHNRESFGWIFVSGYDSIYQVDENGEGVEYAGYDLIKDLSYAD